MSDVFLDFYMLLVAHSVSLVLRLPVNVLVVQMMLWRRWILSQPYMFIEAVTQIFIGLYDALAIAVSLYPHEYLNHTNFVLETILIIGHPSLLTVTSVEQYLAVVKPLLYRRLEPLRCRFLLGGLICAWTLAVLTAAHFSDLFFFLATVVHNIACFGIQLYCFTVIVWALKQPGPGETGGQDVKTSAVKLRALKRILWNTARLLLVYAPLTVICTVNLYIHSLAQRLPFVSEICYAIGSSVEVVQALSVLQRLGAITLIPCL